VVTYSMPAPISDFFYACLARLQTVPVHHSQKKFTPDQFTRLLRRQFVDPRLRFHTRINPDIDRNTIGIFGEYRPYEDEDGEPCLHIYFDYPLARKKIDIKYYDWSTLAYHISDVIAHEYIHLYHCRRRGYRHGRGYRGKENLRYRESMQDYLGCEDEILAYSFNVATEVVVLGKDLAKTVNYRFYRRYFRHDRKIMLKLERYAVKYIKQLERANNEQVNKRTRNHSRRTI